MTTRLKQIAIIEDPRKHAPERVAELRALLENDVPLRPDPRRPEFYEVESPDCVYYIFRYPSGSKVMLLGVWDRDPAATLANLACPAA